MQWLYAVNCIKHRLVYVYAGVYKPQDSQSRRKVYSWVVLFSADMVITTMSVKLIRCDNCDNCQTYTHRQAVSGSRNLLLESFVLAFNVREPETTEIKTIKHVPRTEMAMMNNQQWIFNMQYGLRWWWWIFNNEYSTRDDYDGDEYSTVIKLHDYSAINQSIM